MRRGTAAPRMRASTPSWTWAPHSRNCGKNPGCRAASGAGAPEAATPSTAIPAAASPGASAGSRRSRRRTRHARLPTRAAAREDRGDPRSFPFLPPASLSLPEPGIQRHEAGRVDLELGDDPAPGALVLVPGWPQAPIGLVERFEREARKAKPGRADPRLVSDGETEPPDRKQVGRRAEVQVEVQRAFDLGAFGSVDSPAAGRGDDLDPNGLASDPACHLRLRRPPVRIAENRVVEPARLSFVREDRCSGEFPVFALAGEPGGLVARAVEPSPEDRLLNGHRVLLPPAILLRDRGREGR